MRTLGILILSVTATAIASACPALDGETAAKTSPVVQSPGKGTAGIAVDYRLEGKPAVGVPLQLEIDLATPAEASLIVDINAPAELGFAAGRLRREVAGGETISLGLTPQAEGRFYVDVIARNAVTGLARVVAIPVQVGVAVRKASAVVTGSDGELIVRLPAAE